MKKQNNYYQGKESDFQKTCASYLDRLGLVWCHCPNGGKRNSREASYLKQEGVKAGVPDILIFNKNKQYNGLAIELKVFPNKVSENQKEWLSNLSKLGWKTNVIYSIDDFIDEINSYINN